METRNLVGFEYLEASGNMFYGVDPRDNGRLPGDFMVADDHIVSLACQKAKDCFLTYQQSSLDDRAIFLEEIANEIEKLGDELVQRASSETGLPSARIVGERGRTLMQLRAFAGYIRIGNHLEPSIDTAIPDRIPIPKPDLRKMMMPLGPVVVFGASNFPLAYSVAGGDTAAALAAGCPVLVKAHPAHPGTSALVGQAINEAAKSCHMPEGVFSLLYDNGFSVGQALVGHPAVAAVGFTGSLAGGRALFDIAAKRESPIPVFAEMGSTNPVFLLPHALINRSEEIATNYASSITLGVGQFCTNPGLIFGVRGDELNHFIRTLGEKLAEVESTTMLHKGIAKTFAQRSVNMLNMPGVQLVAQSDEVNKENLGRPMITTVDDAEFLKNPVLHEEVFGPYSMIVQCESPQHMLSCIEALKGQLTGTIIGDDEDLQNGELIHNLSQKVGRLIFNGVPTGVEVCPSMMHGGPYPASTDARFTAVGIHSIKRFMRPVAYQNCPSPLLPEVLRDKNSLGIARVINGEFTNKSI